MARRRVAAAALKDSDALVQRRAAEAIVRQGLTPGRPSFAPIADIYALLRSPDRFVRYSGRVALEHTPRREWVALVMNETNVIALTEGLLALTNTAASQDSHGRVQSELRPIFEKLIALMKQTTLPADQKIRILRAFEIAATEVPGGVDPEIRKTVHDVLIAQFPATAPTATYLGCTNRTEPEAACAVTMMTHHMAKVLAYTGEPDVIGKILAVMPKGNEDQPGQIDYMYALRVIDRGWSPADVKITTDWFAKASKWRGGSTFAGHLNQVFDAVVDAFTPEQKQAAYDAAPLFAPLTPTKSPRRSCRSRGRWRRARGGAGANAPPGAAGAPPAGAPPTGLRLRRRRTSSHLLAPRHRWRAAGRRRRPVVAAVAGAAAAARRRSRATCRSIARNATTTSCFREAVVQACWPAAAAAARVWTTARRPSTRSARSATASIRFGNTYGPDLSNIQAMQRRDILRAIFFPDEKVDPKYETTVIVTRDKQTIRGLVVSEDAQSVMLKTAETADPVTVQKSRISSRTKERTSIMPDSAAGHGRRQCDSRRRRRT